MGQYAVINLSLKSAKQPKFELAYECLLNEIIKAFKRHDYVLQSDKLSCEKDDYINIIKKANFGTVVTSIKFLTECLQKYHNKKVVILIEEGFSRKKKRDLLLFVIFIFTSDYLKYIHSLICTNILN
ncbi:hypothetical protein [Clostridium gasigenes]|uniref:Uncharacterized protein n=1 Tax=Clostridium gasigenes TaxID=94869 RepID=A0A1H0LXN1_9CLOT|nr:hypothetical protein [Clostridium gasigenes]MBB6622339.1 hypothetical protein [Clostridium gasigenes]SDO72864.1 hypothetical protein SAMN04488529_101235 [Clostridium gasigenes]